MSNFMVDLVANRSFAEDLMDKLVEVYIVNLKGYLQAVGDYIQLIQMGDDLGTQDGPQLSPDMYRELIKPRHKTIYQYVKQHSKVYVFLHTCGSVYQLISDFIDEGVDVLNPVQTSAAQMDPRKLKSEYGDKITFWGGGCDTQSVLPRGTPDEIAAHVKERIDLCTGWRIRLHANSQCASRCAARKCCRDVRSGEEVSRVPREAFLRFSLIQDVL